MLALPLYLAFAVAAGAYAPALAVGTDLRAGARTGWAAFVSSSTDRALVLAEAVAFRAGTAAPTERTLHLTHLFPLGAVSGDAAGEPALQI